MTALCAPTLIDRIWPTAPDHSSVRHNHQAAWRFVGLVIAGSALLAVSSKIRIDVGPVPVSLQTFVLLSLAMLYGARLAGATVLAYLFEGAAGLPVFAGTPEKGLGLAYMMGPTGGYLAGFLLAAVVVGMLAERGWDRHMLLTGAAMVIGNALIYIPGLLWLGMLIGWDKPVFELGFTAFLAGDAIKIALAIGLFPTAWAMLNKWSRG
jgi:biotin transport system substrate-specific component